MPHGGLPITGIVFSKDRALQVDATLRSFFRHCRDPHSAHLFVLYKASTEQYARQYRQLAKDYAQAGLPVEFVKEQVFAQDLLKVVLCGKPRPTHVYYAVLTWFLNLLQPHRGLRFLYPLFFRGRLVLFLVDDTVFVRSFSLREVRLSLSSRRDVLGFSLRLGKSITHSYVVDQPQPVPSMKTVLPNQCMFDWSSASFDFGYPLEVSSSVYRVSDIVQILASATFSSPNTLESQMHAKRNHFRRTRPKLLCFESSVAFCAPFNLVQSDCLNRNSGRSDYSPERLASLFDCGYRINVGALDGFTPHACHQEVELSFEQTCTPVPGANASDHSLA